MSGPNNADASQPPAALQAPWRMAYLEGMDAAEKKPAAGASLALALAGLAAVRRRR